MPCGCWRSPWLTLWQRSRSLPQEDKRWTWHHRSVSDASWSHALLWYCHNIRCYNVDVTIQTFSAPSRSSAADADSSSEWVMIHGDHRVSCKASVSAPDLIWYRRSLNQSGWINCPSPRHTENWLIHFSTTLWPTSEKSLSPCEALNWSLLWLWVSRCR